MEQGACDESRTHDLGPVGPRSTAELHPPIFAFPAPRHTPSQRPSAPGRNSRASPADNAFCDEFCLHSLNKLDVMGNWHAMTDSNRRPPRSKRGALSAELMACGTGGSCRNRTCIGRSKNPLPRHSAKDPLLKLPLIMITLRAVETGRFACSIS